MKPVQIQRSLYYTTEVDKYCMLPWHQNGRSDLFLFLYVSGGSTSKLLPHKGIQVLVVAICWLSWCWTNCFSDLSWYVLSWTRGGLGTINCQLINLHLLTWHLNFDITRHQLGEWRVSQGICLVDSFCVQTTRDCPTTEWQSQTLYTHTHTHQPFRQNSIPKPLQRWTN